MSWTPTVIKGEKGPPPPEDEAARIQRFVAKAFVDFFGRDVMAEVERQRKRAHLSVVEPRPSDRAGGGE